MGGAEAAAASPPGSTARASVCPRRVMGMPHALPRTLTLQGDGSRDGFVPWEGPCREAACLLWAVRFDVDCRTEASVSPVLADPWMISFWVLC